MNVCQEVVSPTAKLLDASKYNLRCNRNISEKMTKKDFIYDIPTPMQTVRKVSLLIYNDERITFGQVSSVIISRIVYFMKVK